MKPDLLQSFLKTAFIFAECSSAKRLKVGCIAVKEYDSSTSSIVSIGYNGTPNGWSSNLCEHTETNTTLPEVIHAEMNCICKLAKSGISSTGCILFITHSPCLECAKLIRQSGIQQVYYGFKYRDESGLLLLEKCGIPTIQLEL
jgi:dCMP deaminase